MLHRGTDHHDDVWTHYCESS